MVFKANISHNGKTVKVESDNESLTEKNIGDKIDGSELSGDFAGYELLITGTSDKAGFPGMKDVQGYTLRGVLLKRGWGMHDTREGVRLRKTVRGSQISLDIVQINTKVLKEGPKKFDEIFKPKEKTDKK